MSTKKEKKAPPEPCPKCGATEGWSGPHYHKPVTGVVVNRSHPSRIKRTTVTGPEVLAWSCKVCGYTRLTPTKDTK